MSKSKFTTENIMALLKAASEGQSFMDVIRMSDVQITYHALAGWVGRGRRESKIDLNTPHAKFAAEWDKRCQTFNPRNSQEQNMAAIDRALEMLEEA